MDKSTFIRVFRWLTIFAFSFIVLASCVEEDPLPATEGTEDIKDVADGRYAYVNSWILENMQYWYLWNNELPASTDKNQDPESYFKSLLSADDRFSWIQENYHDLLNSLQGISKEAGYEFVLYREKEGSDNVLMQILYIKPASPAATSGLKRGDVITHINGQQITIQNYHDLLDDIKQDHAVQYNSGLY
jgi:carboxyl-terminal processing protease